MVGEVLEFLNEKQFYDPSSENPQGDDGLKKQVRELSKQVKELERELHEFIGFTIYRGRDNSGFGWRGSG